MRFALGGIANETNTFAQGGLGIERFDVARGDELYRYAGTNHSAGGAIDGCRDLDIEVAPTLYAHLTASGAASRIAFEMLLDEMVARIVAAGELDGVVLALHGAMVAEGYLDAEAEIARRVREATGGQIPIAVALDFHANIGQAMVDAVDIVTLYDTYPHTDQAARAREAVVLLAQVARGELRPTTVLVKPPLMPVPQAQHTEQPPFQKLIDRAHEMEQSRAVAASVAGGFAYADTPDAGMSCLVTTSDDPDRARELAMELARMAWSLRDEMDIRNVEPAAAVAEAMAFDGGLVMLIDVGDNIGGGTPGDGTVLLRELLRQGARGAVMVIADPEAVAAAVAAGVGGAYRAMVGGKTDRLHGDPVLVEGRVRTIGDGRWVHDGPEWAGVPVEMGTTAAVQSDGVTVVLTHRATAPGDLQQLKSIGIEPEKQRIIVVKAAVRWRGGYGPIAKHAIHVDTPGLGSANLDRFTFHQVRRPLWPLDRGFEWP